MRNQQTSWLIVVLVATCVGLFSFAPWSYSGEVTHKEMVWGKEYRIETVDGEPGNYWVYWGDEKIKWEPKPWMAKELKEKGPAFYSYFQKRQQEAGYWPLDIPVNDRQKLDGKTFHDYFYFNTPVPCSYNDFGDKYWGRMLGPRGNEYEVGGFEILKRYRKQAECGEGEVSHKYLFIQTEPEDSSGVGLLQIVYCGEKADDNFLYIPAVRKVRRLATGSRQDFLARSLFRNEDNALCKPIHNYKITGTTLLGPEPKEQLGWDPDDPRNPEPIWRGEDHTHCRGYGEPALVMEITPFREDWWMAKEIKRVGIQSSYYWYGDAYDKEGRLIRKFNVPQGIWYHPRDEGKENPLPYLHWDGCPIFDYLTGYHCLIYSQQVNMDFGVPENIFRERTLTKEVRKLIFWK